MSLALTPEIAIIGAGLSGLALALALHRNGLTNITIYESRPASLDIGGAIMLCPNALRILDAINVYSRLRPQGYEFDMLHFHKSDEALTPVDTFEFGSAARYGYRALRVYRYILIDILHKLINEKEEISIEYNKRFAYVTSETDEQVTWTFSDGSQASASLLIGTDGIHSQVRKYMYPDLEPHFTGGIAVGAAVPTAQLQLPSNVELPLTLMNNIHGAFIIAPQLGDGSEVLIAKQRRFTENLDKAGWADLISNKEWCIKFLREGASDFPPMVANAVSNISENKISLWPYYMIPKLDTWVSSGNNVVIMGDAAHAIPPSAGQGVNQAFEDVYTFAGVIGALQSQTAEVNKIQRRDVVLKKWQLGRQARMERVLELNAMIDKKRFPGQDNVKHTNVGSELSWLYSTDFEQTIIDWTA